MTVCNLCKKSMTGPGQVCPLCIAKVINYADGEYTDTSDPAIKRFNEIRAKDSAPRAASSSGCAVIALVAAAIPLIIAVVGAVHLIA